jgi:hypothetical protein
VCAVGTAPSGRLDPGPRDTGKPKALRADFQVVFGILGQAPCISEKHGLLGWRYFRISVFEAFAVYWFT